MQINSELTAMETMAKLILTAARTAPKARGQDEIVTAWADAGDREQLAVEMEKLAARDKKFAFFKRDAGNVRNADGLILIGLAFRRPVGVDCRACGFDCAAILTRKKSDGDYNGPVCSIRAVDLGIAVGAAAARAKDLCVDNRVMYTVGVAARKLGLLAADVILGMPLSVKGKNIFFDRPG